MKQLKMIRYSAPVIEKPLPEGYSFRLFGGTDAEIEEWVLLCRNGLVPDCNAQVFDDTVRNFENADACRDCLFVADSNGRYVATTTFVSRSEKEGLVHMVASDPSVRGKGIGHAILCEGLKMLEARGMTAVRLTTDDFRLAAIKTYLAAGFKPIIFEDPESDMKARWDKVCEQLGFVTDYVYE